MNFAHIHLMVNHVPLLATLFGGGLLAYGLMTNQRALKSAGLVFGVIAGLSGVAAVMSGERAEDVVEQYESRNEQAIHDHEEAAETARWALAALALISLTGLLLPKKHEKLQGRVDWAAWFVFLITLGMVAWTANLGGPISHPEITDATVVDQR